MKATALKADFKPLEKTIKRILFLAESPHLPIKIRRSVFKMFSQGIIKGCCFSNRLCSINSYATRGTGESWLVFNPSKRLSKLMATLVALDSKSRIARKRRFGHYSTPKNI
jgi:hypothetical protein